MFRRVFVHPARGMYGVAGIYDKKTVAEASAQGMRVVTDHHIDDPPGERGEPRYVVIDVKQHVPFVFESAPIATEASDGRTLVSMTLDARYTEKLKELTTDHLGKSVAMIVGGELVSVHKVRSVISEGKVQITSCGADACKVLHSKLVGER